MPVRHHHPPLHRAAFDVGLHGIDGKALRRHGHIAVQPKRPLAAIGDLAAALQPGQQRLGIGGFDAERDLEAVRRNALLTGLAERNPGRAGRAELQSSQAPGFVVAMQLGSDVLQRASAQYDLLGSKFDLRGDRQMRND